MAVEKTKVISRLKALFPKANLSQKRLDAIADKLAKKPADDADDTAIDAVINDFNDVMSIEEIAKEDDRVRTLEAEKKKAEEAAKKKAGKSEEDDDDNEDDDDTNLSPTDKILKGLTKTIGGLKSELEAIKTGKTLETKQQTVSQLFDSSEVLKGLKPEHKQSWLKRIDLNSETPFEEQISALEAEYTDLFQVTADNGLFPGPAGGGNPSKETDESLVDDVLGIESK